MGIQINIMKRSKDEDVQKAVLQILRKRGHIESLRELKMLVEDQLDVGITGKRLVKIVKNIPNVKIRIHTREDKKGEEITICPVCGNPLKKIFVKSLDGKKVFVGLKCEKCGFESKTKSFKPSRYEFLLEAAVAER